MKFSVHIPFVEHLGFELIEFEGGQAQINYTARPEHLNSFNVTHGGASMTLMDVVMAHAARSVELNMGIVTIEMKTSFMQPAVGPLVATIFDVQGRACSHATGTFKYVRRLPTGAAKANDLNPPATD
jgi:uncharacterized protein (TIGR00369 family)